MDKTTYFYPNKTLRIGDTLLDLSQPRIIGILNVTPDSFFDGGKFNTVDDALRHAEKMIREGADIIDIGGMSSRPGAEMIPEEEEIKRVIPVVDAVKKQFPEMPLSIDTFRGNIAQRAIDAGAGMINDISAGKWDTSIWTVAAKNKISYILMHIQGTPETMQQEPKYENVVKEVFDFFLDGCVQLNAQGIREIIIDPGFGFGKTVEHNYALVQHFEKFKQIGYPIMAGISRKSMICKVLKINPDKALNGSTALHTVLLMKHVDILRVHDVKEAKEVIEIVRHIQI